MAISRLVFRFHKTTESVKAVRITNALQYVYKPMELYIAYIVPA